MVCNGYTFSFTVCDTIRTRRPVGWVVKASDFHAGGPGFEFGSIHWCNFLITEPYFASKCEVCKVSSVVQSPGQAVGLKCMLFAVRYSFHKYKISFFFSFFLSFSFLHLPNAWLTPPGNYNRKCPEATIYRRELDMNQNCRQIHKSGPLWICGQQNVKATARDNTGQKRQRTHNQFKVSN